MKIIYLEADEEVTSIIERLRKEAGEELALVVPRGALLLQSVVNLKLLHREATKLKLQVNLVTADRIGRNLASQAGFSVYSELKGKEPINDIVEREPTDEPPTPPGVHVHRYRVKADSAAPVAESAVVDDMDGELPVTAASTVPPERVHSSGQRSVRGLVPWLIGLTIVGLLLSFFPSATIGLTLPTEEFVAPVTIHVDSKAQSSDLDRRVLSGEALSAELTFQETIPASGRKNIGKKATGTLTLHNRSGAAVPLPSGTRFTTESLIVKTIIEATVPAATAKVSSGGEAVITPGAVEVTAEAEAPGVEYNLKGGTLTPVGLPANQKSVINATVKGTWSGGTTEEQSVVAQSDIDAIKATLLGKATTEATKQLTEKVQDGNLVLSAAVELTDQQFGVSPTAGTETTEVKGTLTVTAQTIAFSETGYRQLVVRDVESRLPSGKSLVLSSNDEIAPQGVSLDLAQGRLTLEGELKTKIGPKIDVKGLTKQLANKRRQAVSALLSRETGATEVEVIISPRLYPRLPLYSWRIVLDLTH